MATTNKDKKTEAPKLELQDQEEKEFQELKQDVDKTAELLEKDAEIEKLKAEIEAMKAAKKDAEPEKPQETAAPAAVVDEWEEYIPVIVPRRGRGEDPYYYVCVNDRSVQIPANGTMQKMRKPHAEALLRSLEAEAKAEKFAQDVPHDAAPASTEQLLKTIEDLKARLSNAGI